jgi:pectate lyase
MDNASAQNVHICNNILSQNIYFQAMVSPNVPAANMYIEHNLVDGYRGHTSEGETRGTFYYTGSPGFIGAAAGNYHIRSDSPTRSGGAPSCAPFYDFDGQVRPTAVVGLGADVIIEYNDKMFLPFLIGQ